MNWKTKYGTLSESMTDFNRILTGLNEPSMNESNNRVASPVYQSDEAMRYLMTNMSNYDPSDMTEAIKHLYALEQDLADTYAKLGQYGLSEMHPHDKRALAQKHDAAHDAAHTAANKAGKAGQQKKHDLLRDKGKQHSKALQKLTGKSNLESIQESVTLETGAPMSRFRELAGLDYYEPAPRDPGRLGTSRFNGGYITEALGEEE